jgi:ATP-dependent exoDNAse (exonuclease V) alpha subunit
MNAAIPQRRPATEEISGLIERVTFHNDESGFCVLRVKARGQREETTVVGSLPSVTAGEWLAAEGWWVRDKEHGLQFKATTMKTVPPTTAEGIERYLGSGLVKGIWPIVAKKLVLGDRTEALVYILAHELRHMHQQHGYAGHSSFPVGRVKNARGRYSQVCTEAYGINWLRAWRRANGA